MTTLLVDGNLDGHAELLLIRLASEESKLFADHLKLQILHLEDVGLERDSPDDEVWRFCQENGYYFLTDNRNMESDSSLEATIRREGTTRSLAVFTLADSKRLYQSPEYLEKVIESLLDRLLSQANLVGAGRVYLP